VNRLDVFLSASAILFISGQHASAASPPASVDPSLIVNYRVSAPTIATAGLITPQGMPKLKELGFRTIVNLRTEQEGAKDEEAAVKAQGLRYEWVPVTAASLSLEDVRKVEKVFEDPDASPILFHCASANRVGAIWAILSVQRGNPLETALEEARQIGLKEGPMTEAVKRLVGAGSAAPQP
jgi:uncharacterized protein (TIGR01244 family)